MTQKGSWKSKKQVWRFTTSYFLFLISLKQRKYISQGFRTSLWQKLQYFSVRKSSPLWREQCKECCLAEDELCASLACADAAQGPRQCSPECCPSLHSSWKMTLQWVLGNDATEEEPWPDFTPSALFRFALCSGHCWEKHRIHHFQLGSCCCASSRLHVCAFGHPYGRGITRWFGFEWTLKII